MPPKSLYKAVGYNDMKRVKIMMEGNDAEKRTEIGSKVQSMALIKRQSTRGVNVNSLNADMD